MEGLESFFTSGQQFYLFLISCFFGFPIGVVFDFFRVVRMVFRHGRIAVIIEDILFFVLYGIFIMCFTITAARSEFRFYYCFGNLLGFILYFVTIGRFVTAFLRKVIEKSKTVIKAVAKRFVLICKKFAGKFVHFFENKKIIKKTKKTLD